MKEQGKTRVLRCTADGIAYQITADERNLYIHNMGRTDSAKDGKMYGTIRVVKNEVEAVRCMRVRGQMEILIVYEGKTSHLVADESVNEALLIAIFGGVPLKLSLNSYSTVLTAQYELRLLSYSFIVTILCFLCHFMPEIEFLEPFFRLGWVVIPFLWLIPCASRMMKGGLRDQFPVGAGMLAAAFSCAFLWVGSMPKIENWPALILPSIAITMLTGSIYFFTRRKADFRAIAVVLLCALVFYAPAAAMCLNELIPLKAERVPAEVQELIVNDLGHRVVVNVDDVRTGFRVSHEDLISLEKGDTVQVVHTTGLLGIKYTNLEF